MMETTIGHRDLIFGRSRNERKAKDRTMRPNGLYSDLFSNNTYIYIGAG